MKIDITEIAREAGVSIATVSRAINNKGPIREATRRKILKIAEKHNYKPNPIARGLSQKKTDTIGVILPDIVDEFFMEIIKGIEEEARKSGFYIMVSCSHDQRNTVETLVEFMSSGRVDGLILMAPKMHSEIRDIITESKRPMVLLNTCEEIADKVNSFNIDNFQGAMMITEHLITAHGYKEIGMILGTENNCDAEERYRGFREALKKHGLPVNDSFLVQGDFTEKSGFYGFNRLMTQSRKPRAIFAANDMMAIGAYEAARSLHVKIPEDVAIVGFDDIKISRFLNPRLTTVHVPIQEISSKATRHLLRIIREKVDPDSPYQDKISTGIIVGGSCGCGNTSSQILTY